MSLRLTRLKKWNNRMFDDSGRKASHYYKGRFRQLDLSYVKSVKVKWNPLYPGGHCARAFKYTLKNNEFAEDHALKCDISEDMHDRREAPTMEFVLRTPQNTTLKFDTQFWQWQKLIKELALWCDYARHFDESQKYNVQNFDWEIMRKQLLDDYNYSGKDTAKLRDVDDDDDTDGSQKSKKSHLPDSLPDPRDLERKKKNKGSQTTLLSAGGKSDKADQVLVESSDNIPAHMLPKLPPTHYSIIYQQSKLQWQDFDQPMQAEEWISTQADSGPVLPTVDGRRSRNSGFVTDRTPQWIHDYRALSFLEDSFAHIDFTYIVTDDHGLVYPQIPQIKDRRWRSKLIKQLGHYAPEMREFCEQRSEAEEGRSPTSEEVETGEEVRWEQRDSAVLAKESQWRKIVD